MTTEPLNDGLNQYPSGGSIHLPKTGLPKRNQAAQSDNLERTSLAIPKNQRWHLLDCSRSFISGASVEDIFQKAVEGLLQAIPQAACSFWIAETEERLISSLEAVQTQLGGGKMSVYRWRGERASLKPGKKPSDSPAARSGSSSLSSKTNGKDAKGLTIPLQVGKRSFGELRLHRKSGPAFSDEDNELAQLFIHPACLAVENDNLQAEVRHHKQMVTRFTPFAESFNRPVRASEITEAIGKGALAISGADRAAVFGQDCSDQVNHVWSQGISSGGLAKMLETSAENTPTEPSSIFVNNILDLPEHAPWQRIADQEGITALAVCPIVFENVAMASIGCFFDHPHEWSQTETEALELFARQAAVALENSRLYEELEESYLQTVLTMARMLDVRDAYTARHSRRLTAWAEGTARKLNCSPEEIKLIRWAAMLHDIGKIGIPDSILLKAGPLTDDEWAVMKRHPEVGAEIVAPLKKLRQVTPIIRAHQEKFDGSGYPDGLAGEQIPLAARILTVVDAFGAMTDDRVFRKARTQAEAVDELRRCAGKHFDQKVVQVFFEVIEAAPLMN